MRLAHRPESLELGGASYEAVELPDDDASRLSSFEHLHHGFVRRPHDSSLVRGDIDVLEDSDHLPASEFYEGPAGMLLATRRRLGSGLIS